MYILNMWKHDDGWIVEKWQSVVRLMSDKKGALGWSSFQELFGKGEGATNIYNIFMS